MRVESETGAAVLVLEAPPNLSAELHRNLAKGVVRFRRACFPAGATLVGAVRPDDAERALREAALIVAAFPGPLAFGPAALAGGRVELAPDAPTAELLGTLGALAESRADAGPEFEPFLPPRGILAPGDGEAFAEGGMASIGIVRFRVCKLSILSLEPVRSGARTVGLSFATLASLHRRVGAAKP